MATTVNLKFCIADLTPIHLAHPTASRSLIVRSIIYAVASLDGPLVVSEVEPPRAALWTSVSMDVSTEMLGAICFKKNGAKNLSAIVYHAVRDPRVLERVDEFLGLSEHARKRRVDALVLESTGEHPGAVEEEAAAEAEAPAALLAYCVSEVSRTEKDLERAQKAHDAARAALLACRRAFGEAQGG